MTLGSHQSSIGKSQVHLTPRRFIDALGPFDLDPCAATVRPWDCAAQNIVEEQDGLSVSWSGFVWCNPPFDRRGVGEWVERMAAHDCGIMLLHARTETEWFRPIWRRARAILFLDTRIAFCTPDGRPQAANSGAPVVLCAFGGLAEDRLRISGLGGALVRSWEAMP